eukprot:g17055.t1
MSLFRSGILSFTLRMMMSCGKLAKAEERHPCLQTSGDVEGLYDTDEITNGIVKPDVANSDQASELHAVPDSPSLNEEDCGTTTSCSTDVPDALTAQDKLIQHQRGLCRPCAYFRMKADGCRKGDALPLQAAGSSSETSRDTPWEMVLMHQERQPFLSPLASPVFDQIDQEPLGAASIGQAHRVVWQGRPAVVKVQYPDAAAMLRADFRCLELLLWLLHDAFQVAPDFKGRVVLPEPIPELTSGHVIGMGFLDGPKLEVALRSRLEALGVDLGKQGIGEWLAAQQRNGINKNFSSLLGGFAHGDGSL